MDVVAVMIALHGGGGGHGSHDGDNRCLFPGRCASVDDEIVSVLLLIDTWFHILLSHGGFHCDICLFDAGVPNVVVVCCSGGWGWVSPPPFRRMRAPNELCRHACSVPILSSKEFQTRRTRLQPTISLSMCVHRVCACSPAFGFNHQLEIKLRYIYIHYNMNDDGISDPQRHKNGGHDKNVETNHQDNDTATTTPMIRPNPPTTGIKFVDYHDESQLDHVMSLVGRDLSEPYSSTYY